MKAIIAILWLCLFQIAQGQKLSEANLPGCPNPYLMPKFISSPDDCDGTKAGTVAAKCWNSKIDECCMYDEGLCDPSFQSSLMSKIYKDCDVPFWRLCYNSEEECSTSTDNGGLCFDLNSIQDVLSILCKADVESKCKKIIGLPPAVAYATFGAVGLVVVVVVFACLCCQRSNVSDEDLLGPIAKNNDSFAAIPQPQQQIQIPQHQVLTVAPPMNSLATGLPSLGSFSSLPSAESQPPVIMDSTDQETIDRRKNDLFDFYLEHDPTREDIGGHVDKLFSKYRFENITKAVMAKYNMLPAGWEQELAMMQGSGSVMSRPPGI